MMPHPKPDLDIIAELIADLVEDNRKTLHRGFLQKDWLFDIQDEVIRILRYRQFPSREIVRALGFKSYQELRRYMCRRGTSLREIDKETRE